MPIINLEASTVVPVDNVAEGERYVTKEVVDNVPFRKPTHKSITVGPLSEPKANPSTVLSILPKDNEPSLENQVLMLEDDDDVVEVPCPAKFARTAPKKKRTTRLKEQLDDIFLRRSKRISNKQEGFKNESSDVLDIKPLEMIPPPGHSRAHT